jgi:hypothetical protein
MSFETPATFTDPAAELAEVVHWLNSLTETHQNAHDVIAVALDLQTPTSTYFEAIGALVDRAETLHALVERLATTSALLTVGTKAHLQGACNDLVRALSPNSLGRGIKEVLATMPPDTAVRFEFGSAIVKQYVRLRIYPEAARLQKIQELQEQLAALDEPPGPQNWNELALRQGLRRLIFMLRTFRFFGHAAIEGEARSVGIAAEVAVIQAQANGDERAGHFKTIARTAAAVMVAVCAINATDDTLTSLGHLTQWASGQDPYGIVGVTRGLPAPTK